MTKSIAILVTCSTLAVAGVTQQEWGKAPSGEIVYLYTLTNAKGMEARITNLGCILVSLKVPDRHGKLADVVLGFDTLDQYVKSPRYYGAVVGRYANRIAKAQFELGGQTYKLTANNGENTLHGGPHGFNKVVWTGTAGTRGAPSVKLTYLSKDGEEGFPGNLTVEVRYTLTTKNELRIDYSATTDKPTVINLANHSFFNLAGESSGSVLDHVATIGAAQFTPLREGSIPTGDIRSVVGTPFDLRKPVAIGSRIHEADPQMQLTQGFDHNYVLSHPAGRLGFAARIVEPKSGRVLEVLTTEPGMQFYTANTLDGTGGGKGGKSYAKYAGFCVETQHFPDSPHQPKFPSTVLRPRQRFQSSTVFRFGTER